VEYTKEYSNGLGWMEIGFGVRVELGMESS